MRWPIDRATGSISGFSTSSCSTVVPWSAAIVSSVSPASIS
jgi:hypothetical protein